MAENASDPTLIERDLDHARSRLGSHLSQLQDRLSPGQVLDDLMGYFRGSEGAEFGRSLLDNVRGNPMPAAITAVGLAWLMASKPGARTTGQASDATGWERFGMPAMQPAGPHLYGREDYGAAIVRVHDAERGIARHSDEAEHAYSARLDEVRGQAIGLARHAQETTESFGERVRDALAAAERAVAGTAQGLREQVGSAMGTAGNAAGTLGASAQNAAQGAVQSALGALSQSGKAGGSLAATFAESPVLLGALGLAAGALLGALLPVSEQEEAALGGIAGQARDTAASLAKEGLERGKTVAQAVADKGRASADAHGLAGGKSAGELLDAALSGDLAGNAKAVVHDVLQTGEEAVRKEVAPSGSETAGRPARLPNMPA